MYKEVLLKNNQQKLLELRYIKILIVSLVAFVGGYCFEKIRYSFALDVGSLICHFNYENEIWTLFLLA